MRASEFFQKATEQGKLSHAYLFSGNDTGTKAQVIGDFLKTAHIHPADLTQIEPAEKEISIAQIRQLAEFVSLSAWNSPYKVAIIAKAHTMNREAASAFLKLLEEPKGDTVVFLLTQYPELLLDTILSRCQELKFYTFGAVEIPVETKKEFEKLQTVSLHNRFVAAKKLADTPEEIPQLLAWWIALLRQDMVETAKTNTSEAHAISGKIKTAQEVAYILQTTNANPRLALERLMLDI